MITPQKKYEKSVIERFLKKVKKTSSCWHWTHSAEHRRYGYFFLNGRVERINRVSWLLFRGNITNNLLVLHTCDNTKCVNPAHLYLGTQSENNRDAHVRSRRSSVGLNNGNVKLNPVKVRQIRNKYNIGNTTHSRLAIEYGVTKSAITDILKFKNWKFI